MGLLRRVVGRLTTKKVQQVGMHPAASNTESSIIMQTLLLQWTNQKAMLQRSCCTPGKEGVTGNAVSCLYLGADVLLVA